MSLTLVSPALAPALLCVACSLVIFLTQPPYQSLPPVPRQSPYSTESKLVNKVVYSYPTHTRTVSESMTLIYGSDDDQEEFPDRVVGELPERDVATGPRATCFAVTDTPAQRGSGHGMYEVTSQEKSREQPEELQRRSSEASKCSSKASRCSTGCHKKDRVGVRRKDFQNSAGRLQRNDSAASGKRKTCLESQSTMKKKLNSKQKSNTGHDSPFRSLDSIKSELAALSDTRVTRKEGDKMSSSAVDVSHTVSFNADLGVPVKASRSCPSPDSGGLGSDSDKDPAPKLMPEEHPSALPDQRMLSVSDVMEAELPPQIPRDRFHPEGRDPPVANGQRPSVDTRIELIQSQLDNIYDKMKRFHNIYPDIPAVDLLESQSHEDIGENEPFDVAGNSSYNLYSNRATKDSLSLSESVLVAALAEDSGQLSQHDDWTSSIMADIEAQRKFDSVKKMLQSCVGDDWMKLVGAYHYQPVPESVTSTPKEYLEAPIPARGNRSTSAPRSAYTSAPQGQHSAGVPGSTAPSDFYSLRMPTSSYRSSPHPPRAPCNEAPVPPAAPLRQAHATKGATPTTKAPIAFTSSGLDARVTTFPKSPPDRSPASVHPEVYPHTMTDPGCHKRREQPDYILFSDLFSLGMGSTEMQEIALCCMSKGVTCFLVYVTYLSLVVLALWLPWIYPHFP